MKNVKNHNHATVGVREKRVRQSVTPVCLRDRRRFLFSDHREAIGPGLETDDRVGGTPKAFGQHVGSNDRVGPPVSARRKIFQERGALYTR